MKTITMLITVLSAAILLAPPALAQDIQQKEVHIINLPPSSYKQITPEEAKKIKKLPSDQKEISVTLERVSDKANGNKK